MPTYATSVQNENQLWMGSAKVEVSVNGGGAWTNLGIARNISVEEQPTFTKVETDNAPACKRRIGKHIAKISFTLLELYWPTIDKLRGEGVDTVTSVAGSLVEDADQVVASGDWGYNEFIEFTNQNGDGTCVTVNSVTAGTNGALVEETDFVTVQDGNGKWGIIIWDSTTVTTEAQTITINTDYTPSASTTFSTGGLTEIGDIDLKFTNTEYISGSEKTKYLWIYKAYIMSGLNMAFKSSNDDDQAMEIPFEFEAELDTTRTAGDQLMIISDDA